MAVKVEIGIVCTPGPESGRPGVNKDNYLLCRDGKARFRKGENATIREAGDQGILLAVSDGLGNGRDGEIAATAAVQSLPLLLDATWPPGATPEEHLRLYLLSSHHRIRDAAKAAGPVRMGAALTVAWLLGSQVHWAHIGDTRLYHLRYRQLHQITRDHSLVARMVEQNRLSPEEARNHPHANILLRTVGTERDVDIDIFTVELEKGDRLLLCSDGLWGEIEDQDIEAILNHYADPRVVCREMVRAALHGGGRDNVTTVLVEI